MKQLRVAPPKGHTASALQGEANMLEVLHDRSRRFVGVAAFAVCLVFVGCGASPGGQDGGGAAGGGSAGGGSATDAGTDGGTTCPPMRIVDFSGLANGEPISSRVDYWGARGTNGFGSFATTTRHMPWATSAAEFRIAAGTTGRAGDGSPTQNGDFGFGISFPGPDLPGEGDDVWVGTWVYFPAGFDLTAGPGFLKFMRFTYSNEGGKLELALTSTSGMHDGFNVGNEFDPNLQPQTVHHSSQRLTTGRWHWVESHALLTATRSAAVRTIWIDDELVARRETGTTRWYTDGGVTDSVAVDERTLPTAQGTMDGVMLFTYWNAGSPVNQSAFVQRLVIATSTPTGRDSQGHPMIGSACAQR